MHSHISFIDSNFRAHTLGLRRGCSGPHNRHQVCFAGEQPLSVYLDEFVREHPINRRRVALQHCDGKFAL
jgi:hypothetical protein